VIAAVLGHAGFRTVAVDDVQSAAPLLKTSTFAAIVRDVNLAPPVRRRSMQDLAATAPELLRRTVVITTAPSRAETARITDTVFAIVSKPFDIDTLVSAVRACARVPEPRRSERVTDPSVRLESLQRFVKTVPSLHRLLSVPVTSDREAELRAAMRRTLGTLAAMLADATHVEASSTRAAVYRAASTVAGRLANGSAPESRVAESGREH
jgi:DNA-binding response OmpR family regulator